MQSTIPPYTCRQRPSDWSTNRKLYYTQHRKAQCISFQHHPPRTFNLHLHICYHLHKNIQNKLQKKHFAKKCKNKSCRDALPPKNTSPKTNETSDNAHRTAMHVQTTHTFIAMHLPHSYHPYIFPTTPTKIRTMPPYSTAHSIHVLPSTHTIINHATLPPSSNHPYILILNHYITKRNIRFCSARCPPLKVVPPDILH